MPAEVESMFYVRETPWHGLGTNVKNALSSNEALTAAKLDWNVIQKEIKQLTIFQYQTLEQMLEKPIIKCWVSYLTVTKYCKT